MDEGWSGELGPMRIPTTHFFTRALIRRFGLATAVFQQGPSLAKLFIRGESAMKASVFMSSLGRMHFFSAYDIPKNESHMCVLQVGQLSWGRNRKVVHSFPPI